MLNNLQKEAIEMAKKHSILLIKGAGGTGKTHVVKELIEDLIREHSIMDGILDIYAVAPSHKAKFVLMEALEVDSETSILEVELPSDEEYGKDSLLYGIKNMSYGTLRVQTISKYGNFRPDKKGNYFHTGHTVKTCDLLIIDEVSMLTQDHWGTIKNSAKKIILLGDPDHQLLSPAKAKRVNLDGIPFIELTEQMRQKNTDSSLYKLLTQYRNYENPHDIKSDLSLQAVNSEEELMMAYHQCASTSKTILAHTNESINAYNTFYKIDILKEPFFKEGDEAVMQKPLESKRKTVFNNGDHVFIVSSSLSGKKGSIRGKNSDEVYETSFHPSILKHIFAQTITKSQGSTYDYVFIDMSMTSYMNEEEKRRLLYTAFSRARIQVVFLNSKVNKGKTNG